MDQLNLSSDKVLENIEKFFKGLIIRMLNVDKLQEKIKELIFSGKVTDIDEWKKFLEEEILNSEFVKASKEIVSIAMDNAKETYGDQTLPFLALLFLADSSKDTFNTAFKALNLARHAQEAVAETKDVVNQVKSGDLFSGGLIQGIKVGVQSIQKVAEVGKQAVNPSIIKKTDIKNLSAYFTNFITLLPVEILAKSGEGIRMPDYIVTILKSAFDKTVQENFVEKKIFSKYNDKEEINVDDFFNDNYEILKDDSGIRKGMVDTYLDEKTPTFIKNLKKNSSATANNN